MNKNSPKLSIIVPVYNMAPFLRRCLDSILGETLTDLEVIVVDDGSTDESPAICDEYGKRDARIRVIHQQNGGLGFARKVGMDLACGEFVTFVDSDDWVEPEMHERLCRTADEQACDMVICDWTNRCSANNTVTVQDQSPLLRENHVYEGGEFAEQILPKVLLGTIRGYSWNKLYRNSLLKQCDFAKTIGLSNWQDWVLNCEYVPKARRLAYVKTCMYNYVIHPGNSLFKNYKDYLPIILRLHAYRMGYLKLFKMDDRADVRDGCIRSFMEMAQFAAFEYEFLFAQTKLREKLRKISAVVNHPEVACFRSEYARIVAGQALFFRIRWLLFCLKSPLLIYVFSKSFERAKNLKRRFKR